MKHSIVGGKSQPEHLHLRIAGCTRDELFHHDSVGSEIAGHSIPQSPNFSIPQLCFSVSL
jgi:hypothetical protein